MGTKLYVGNLHANATEESIKVAFSGDGRSVRGVTLPCDRVTGRPRGFAFVEMGSDQEAIAAIAAMHGTDLDGRTLTVNEAQQRPASRNDAFRST